MIYNIKDRYKFKIFLLILLLSPICSSGQIFCIHNQSELETALQKSSKNKENDSIKIVEGSTLQNFKIPKEIGFLIKISRGYSLDCTKQRIDMKNNIQQNLISLQQQTSIQPAQSTTGPIPPKSVMKNNFFSSNISSQVTEAIVLGVPAYKWRHGCGPTAVGMVIGYWDSKGYQDLFTGSANTQTEAVNQGIASQGNNSSPRHYEDYSLPQDSYPNLLPDQSENTGNNVHISDSIADFMFTSWSSKNNYYGWSWSNHITPSFTNYVKMRNSSYKTITGNYYFGSSLPWNLLTTEINEQRPMVFLVDSDGDGYTDHFITIVGYKIENNLQYYGALDTWYPYDVIRWERFRGISSDYAWGIWGGFSFRILKEKFNTVPILYLLN